MRIPEGCARIHYGERYHKIPECRYVVSATASPNVTLERVELEKWSWSIRSLLWIWQCQGTFDTSIRELSWAEVYDIDDFQGGIGLSERQQEQLQAANLLAEEELAAFVSWYECRDMVPQIQKFGALAAQDVSWRMGRTFQQMKLDASQCRQLADAVEQTSQKVFQKMLFGLRDHADTDVMRECLAALEKVWKEE